MASTTSFISATRTRRSIYTLSKASAFNVHSARCLVLFGVEHDKL
jgi:predicted oxidoreductase (fatty acid repression mutant protein)